ncbi:MAG: response regulator [Spirochaetes bacterium]|nr:response regulator [Spirochaetota bacterium]
MRFTGAIIILSSALCLFAPGGAWSEPLVLTDDADHHNLLPYSEYLEDTSRTMTYEEASSPTNAGKYIRLKTEELRFSFTQSAYWIRFTLVNRGARSGDWVVALDSYGTNYVDFYFKNRDGTTGSIKTGEWRPFHTRGIKNRFFVFRSPLDRNETRTFYLRLDNGGNVLGVPLSVMTMERYYTMDHDRQMWLGIYYGAMMIMILFNLVLFAFLRDRNYLYLSLFTASWILLQGKINGIAFEYLFPNSISWLPWIESSLAAFVDLFATLFLTGFLDVKRRYPRVYRYIQILLCCIVLQMFSPLLFDVLIENIVSDGVIIICVVTAIVVAVTSMVDRYKPARFYLLAWSLFLVGSVLFVLSDYDILPETVITRSGMQFGSIFLVLFFNVALADRYRLLKLQKEDAEKANREMTTFFINMAHEMKTPLTLLTNYVDLFIEQQGSGHEITIIKRNIDKLARDMTNFFDVMKLRRGSIVYNHDAITDVGRTVSLMVDMYDSMARGRNITVRTTCGEGLFVKADPAAIERMLTNLVDNAMRYNREGGTIDLSADGDGADIRLVVKDTGIGIAREELPFIFMPYYQISHEKRNTQGIGMGLALVKEIIDSLPATIGIDSEPGLGTTVTVRMKRHILKAGESAARWEPVLIPDGTLPLRSHSDCTAPQKTGGHAILLVEDNADLLELMRRKLGARYTVYTATDGVQGLEVLERRGTVDVIVSDIMMDGMDGIRFFRTLSSSIDYRDIPFIFVTARSRHEEKIEGLKSGAIDYIFKPFSIEELVHKIESILRYGELKKALYEKDKYSSLGMLMGAVAHELFNPLSGISGPLANLKRLLEKSELTLDEKALRYISSMEKSIETISEIVARIRKTFMADEIAREPFDPAAVIDKMIEAFGEKHNGRIHFKRRIDGVKLINGNRDALELILSNLLSNAADAIEGYGTITVSLGRMGGRTLLSVSDTGRGITANPDESSYEATPVERAGTGRLGTGLDIVKNLATRLGWSVTVELDREKGSAISVILDG